MEKKQEFMFDKRVTHRFVAKGKLTNNELNKHLSELVDLKEQYENIADNIFADMYNSNKAHKTSSKLHN